MVSRDCSRVYLIDFGRAWIFAQEGDPNLVAKEASRAHNDLGMMLNCFDIKLTCDRMVGGEPTLVCQLS